MVCRVYLSNDKILVNTNQTVTLLHLLLYLCNLQFNVVGELLMLHLGQTIPKLKSRAAKQGGGDQGSQGGGGAAGGGQTGGSKKKGKGRR